MLLQVVVVYFFFLLYSISLCGYIMFCFSIHLLMDIYIVSSFCCEQCCYEDPCECLLEHMYTHFCWVLCITVALVGHRVCMCSASVGTVQLFPKLDKPRDFLF